MMDIDLAEDTEASVSSKLAGKKPQIVPIDDVHPFDLDTYISSYTGRTVVDRLIHIVSLCPTLAPQCFRMAAQQIARMRDPSLYGALLSAHEHIATFPSLGLPPLDELIAPLDANWPDEIAHKNQAERGKLELELKTYTSNMIKESIRMAHRDLGEFYRAVGDYANSLKHFTKSREFCTTSQQVLDMCLSVLELLLEQRNYGHLMTYVFKAEAALEATAGALRASGGAGATTANAGPSKEKLAAERESVQTKLDLASALSQLGQGQYDKAAMFFLKIGPAKGLGDWIGKIVSAADIAIYATLCTLATSSRSAIRTQLLENDGFSGYIEQESYIRELIESYLASRFSTVLELIERYSTRHCIDIHLSSHVVNLTNLIRNRALVLYFQPFATIKLDRMSRAFGWSLDELEKQIVSLIDAGEIHARIDRQNKILKAKETDQRAALFARAMKAGTEMQAANRRLLLRMRLQQADLIVRVPKGGPSAITGHPSELLPSDPH